MSEQRKYATMGPIPGELVDDTHAYPTLLAMRQSEWIQAVNAEGYRAVGAGPTTRLSDPVETTYNNHEGRGWWYRLFHRYREWTSVEYMLRVEGYCEPINV